MMTKEPRPECVKLAASSKAESKQMSDALKDLKAYKKVFAQHFPCDVRYIERSPDVKLTGDGCYIQHLKNAQETLSERELLIEDCKTRTLKIKLDRTETERHLNKLPPRKSKACPKSFKKA